MAGDSWALNGEFKTEEWEFKVRENLVAQMVSYQSQPRS